MAVHRKVSLAKDALHIARNGTFRDSAARPNPTPLPTTMVLDICKKILSCSDRFELYTEIRKQDLKGNGAGVGEGGPK